MFISTLQIFQAQHWGRENNRLTSRTYLTEMGNGSMDPVNFWYQCLAKLQFPINLKLLILDFQIYALYLEYLTKCLTK